MQNTRLGIKVGLLGAALFFLGLFGGYTSLILMAGYILLFEENPWLRRSAVKAAILLVIFSFISTIINLVPDGIDVVVNFISMFNNNFYASSIKNFFSAIVGIVNIVEKVLFLGLGIKALNQGTIVIPWIDNLISKYMN